MENNSAYMIRVATKGKLRPLPPGMLEEEILDNLQFFTRGIEITPGGYLLVNNLDLTNYLSSREQRGK